MQLFDQISSIKSLDDLRQRKEALLTDIRKDDEQIQGLWHGLFHKPDLLSNSPTRRFSGLMSAGVGAIDMCILGWKLYRKFHRSSSTFSQRKRRK